MRAGGPSRYSFRWLPVLVLVVGLVGGLACGLTSALAASPTPAASSSAAGPVVLKLGWTQEPDNLNVFVGYNATCWEIWALNYDYLFRCGDRDQPTLDLASAFPTQQNGGISPDGKTWTIHIRSGVRFQDGTPLTAADVAFTYNYIIDNDIAQYTLYTAGIESVKALDPTTVQFTCAHPMAEGFMETQTVPILPEHIWKHVSPSAATTSYGSKPPTVGSGPFETVGYVHGTYIEMVRNPYYWGKKPTVDKIYFEVYTNADTMVADLRSGEIDGITGDIPTGGFAQLKSVTGIEAVAYPFYAWDDLMFNCYAKASSLGNPVVRDPKFRQALNYAIDKQPLCTLAYQGYAAPGTTVITPDTFTDPDYHWQPPAGEAYSFDLAKAGQMLTAAGYPLKNGVRLDKQGKPIVLRLDTPTDSTSRQSESKLVTGRLRQLGLTIDFSVLDSGALAAKMFNQHGNTWAPDFDLIVWGYVGSYDPGQTLGYFTTSQIGGSNGLYWSNPEFDKLAVAQASATDPARRQALIWQMQQIMYQQSPMIVLVYPDSFEAFNTAKWTGWSQLWGTGPAWNCQGNITSYLDLTPKVASTPTSGGSSSTLIVVAVVAVIVVAGVVLVVVRRRRKVEEDT